MFELADGRVFFSGGRMDDDLPVAPCVIDLNKNPCKPKLFQVQPGGPCESIRQRASPAGAGSAGNVQVEMRPGNDRAMANRYNQLRLALLDFLGGQLSRQKQVVPSTQWHF
ncbi:MAG: hypothetical protein ABIN99_14180 [Nitrosospira sp.]